MADVLVYSTSWCPYCVRAKALLKRKGVAFREVDLDHEPHRRDEMVQRSGRMTVPQVFVGETHVGGSEDLLALERAGKLDALLGSDQP